MLVLCIGIVCCVLIVVCCLLFVGVCLYGVVFVCWLFL